LPIETEIGAGADEAEENDDPSLGIFDGSRVSMPESEFSDQWGNLKGTPLKVIEEKHGENSVKIFIYEYRSINTVANGRPADYYFGFQLKIDRLIRQKRANIADRPMRGVDEARSAAQKMIIDICKKNKVVKKTFAEFTSIRYNQPELF